MHSIKRKRLQGNREDQSSRLDVFIAKLLSKNPLVSSTYVIRRGIDRQL